MNQTLNLLVGLAMGFNLLALASSRLPSIIRAAAFIPLGSGVPGGALTAVPASSGWSQTTMDSTSPLPIT